MAEVKTKRMPDTTTLGEEKIPRLVLKFTSTTIAGLLLNAVYFLTDALFVSWGVGDNAMGGVSIVFPFVILQGAISTTVGAGAASVVSRKLGEGKTREAGETTLNAMLIFYISAAVISVLGFVLLDPLLEILGVTGTLYPFAKRYFMILLAGNVFSTGFSSIIRAEGRMFYSLLIWIIPISSNIVFDAVLILGLKMGVTGSALATVICQVMSAAMSVLFFTRYTCQSFRCARPSFRKAGEVIAFGLPSLVQMGSLSVVSAVINNVLRDAGGTLSVNTFAYISKIMTFAAVPFTAVTQALAPIIGYNHGAGKTERVNKTIRFCVLLCLGYAVAATVAAEAVPRLLIRVFTDNENIISLGAAGLRMTAASLIFSPLPLLAGASFQAMGYKTRALTMYSANAVFLIPSAFLMAKNFGVNGVWWAYVAANAAASVFASVMIIYSKKKQENRALLSASSLDLP